MNERAGRQQRTAQGRRWVDGPRSAPPAAPTARRASYGLTVADVVPRGGVVGVDESYLVRTLLGAVVAAGPALIGSTSLDVVSTLTATRQAVDRELVVRLFGGELRRAAGAFAGPRGVQAVTDTACDVALVAGRLVDGVVWVPADVRTERLALVLAARRAYLVCADDDPPPRPRHVDSSGVRITADPIPDGPLTDDPLTDGPLTDDPTTDDPTTDDTISARPWATLAPLTAFDGVLELVAPHSGPRRRPSHAA